MTDIQTDLENEWVEQDSKAPNWLEKLSLRQLAVEFRRLWDLRSRVTCPGDDNDLSDVIRPVLDELKWRGVESGTPEQVDQRALLAAHAAQDNAARGGFGEYMLWDGR